MPCVTVNTVQILGTETLHMMPSNIGFPILSSAQQQIRRYLIFDPLCLSRKPESADSLCTIGLRRRDVGNHDCL